MNTTNDQNHENLPETTFGAAEVGRSYLTTRGHEVTVTEVVSGDHAIVETRKGKVMRVPVTQVCHGPLEVADEPAEPGTDVLVEDAPTTTEEAPKCKRDMTIEDLQAEFLKVIGRETTSTDRRYLLWRLSAGGLRRSPVGSSEKRASRDKADTQVLPLTLTRETTRLLDAAVKAAGIRSRSAFIRAALIEKLHALGSEEDIAASNALQGENY